MNITKLTPKKQGYPNILLNISSPPKQLFYLGLPPNELLNNPVVAIVGSRKVTSYGRRITEELAYGLAQYGIIIVSGLALGVDAIAHQAALAAKGKTIAVLPSGLDKFYPSTNSLLAQKIIDAGGCLVSEYPQNTEPFLQNFVARNRIVSGLSQALIITEAAEKSGSLHTAKFALDQGREVGAVPGSIYSQTSVGTNNLIKSGAAMITSVAEALDLIGLTSRPQKKKEIIAANVEENILLSLINEGFNETEVLLRESKMKPAIFNQTLTLLEISGKVKIISGQIFLI